MTHRVAAEQLDGAAYDAAWAHITARSPSFLDYVEKTDRRLPVLRLTPVAATRSGVSALDPMLSDVGSV